MVSDRYVNTRRGSVTSATLEGTANWTLDVWGQVRRLVEENSATAQADEAILANATLSEQALLATTVIELRAADALIDLDQKTVMPMREALRITKAQGQAGITATPPSAVITAQVALETAQASLIGCRRRACAIRARHCRAGRQKAGGPGHSSQRHAANACPPFRSAFHQRSCRGDRTSPPPSGP